MSDRTRIARIAASLEAQVAHASLARAGRRNPPTPRPAVAQRLPAVPRRRPVTLPRVSLDVGPTPERFAKAPGGVEVANGTRARRLRSTMDTVSARLTGEEIEAARQFIADYLVAEAGARQRITTAYNGTASGHWTPPLGGVMDHARSAFARMELAYASMDRRFWDVLEKLAIGVRRERDGTPWTLEEIGKQFMGKAYNTPEANRAVAVGLLKGALWRVHEFYCGSWRSPRMGRSPP